MHLTKRLQVSITGLLSTLAAAGFSAPAFAQSGNEATGPALEEIVVTAQRRAETLLEVPIAITAISEEDLQAGQVSAVVDVIGRVPNVHVSNNIGQGSAVTTFIRGVGDTESIVTIDNPVGFYVDDVYIGRTGANNAALFDVERVEVLRGPQGTLYGRNTSGGALKIISNKPSFDGTSGRVEASYGSFSEWRLKGRINAALSDNTAFRAAAVVGDDDGDTVNIGTNSRVNGTELAALKASMLTNFGENTSLLISADWMSNDQEGRHAVGVFGLTPPPTESLYVINTNENMRNEAEAFGISANIAWDVSDNLTINSITAFRNTQQQYNLESSDQPDTLFDVYSDVDSDQFSQEFQFTGVAMDQKLSYVAGLYYFDEQGDSFIGNFIAQAFWLNGDLNVDTESYAAFAEFNYALTEQVSLIFGGRYTNEEKSVELTQRLGDVADVGFEPSGFVLFDTDDLTGRIIPARPDRPVQTTLDDDPVTIKLGLEYAFHENWNAYFTYTEGFKSGGWSARIFFDPDEFFDFDAEEIDSFEIGLKGRIGNVGQISLAAFHYDYSNLFNTGTTATGFGIATSDAEIQGLELETNWALTDGLDAYVNVAVQDNERKDISQTSITLGDEFQRAPEFQFGIGFDGRIALSDNMDLSYNLGYSYQDEHFVDPQNSPEGRTGPIRLLNALVAMSWNDKYRVSLGCRNCTQEEYIDQLLNFPAFGFITVYPGERRNWTLAFSADF